jgi:hypothetical protein
MKRLIPDPFERPFEPADVHLFGDLVHDILGKKLTRWRETYAEGIVLDCGELMPKLPVRSATSRDRGEWVISTWGCDISVRQAASMSSMDTFENVKAALASIVGRPLMKLSIDPGDLSLTATFDGDSEILLMTDRDDPELDQWFITTPSGGSIGVSASGTWYYRSAQPGLLRDVASH